MFTSLIIISRSPHPVNDDAQTALLVSLGAAEAEDIDVSSSYDDDELTKTHDENNNLLQARVVLNRRKYLYPRFAILLTGLIAGMLTQAYGIAIVLQEEASADTTGNSWRRNHPTKQQVEKILDGFATVVKGANSILTALVIVGIIGHMSTMIMMNDCLRRRFPKLASGIALLIRVGLAFFVAFSVGAGCTMLLSRFVIISWPIALSSLTQLSLVSSLIVCYLVLVILLGAHEVLMAAIQQAEEDEDQSAPSVDGVESGRTLNYVVLL